MAFLKMTMSDIESSKPIEAGEYILELTDVHPAKLSESKKSNNTRLDFRVVTGVYQDRKIIHTSNDHAMNAIDNAKMVSAFLNEPITSLADQNGNIEIDMDTLIGKQVRVKIVLVPNKDNTRWYSNIIEFYSLDGVVPF